MTDEPRVISAENPLASIGDLTYVIEHNANCPKPFKMRLVGAQGYLDHLPPAPFGGKVTRDILGHGLTLQEAVVEAASKHEERMAAIAAIFRPGAKRRLVYAA